MELSFVGSKEGLMDYLEEEQWRQELQRSQDLEDLMRDNFLDR